MLFQNIVWDTKQIKIKGTSKKGMWRRRKNENTFNSVYSGFKKYIKKGAGGGGGGGDFLLLDICRIYALCSSFNFFILFLLNLHPDHVSLRELRVTIYAYTYAYTRPNELESSRVYNT